MWAIFPLQDVLDMEPSLRSRDPILDAINRPGEKDGCWKYRMPMTVNTLVKKEEFTKAVHAMIVTLGRDDTY